MRIFNKSMLLCAGTAVAAALLTAPSQAALPTFSCDTKHINDAERTICQSNYLGSLDQRMATTYYEVGAQLGPSARNKIRRTQIAWLRHRNGCGDARWCIARMYHKRLRQLTGYDNCFDHTASPGCVSRKLTRHRWRWELRRVVQY